MDFNHHPSEPPSQSTAIRIAQISPDRDHLSESSIRAVVTLIWPYSSSTKTFIFLLAEPDFRLRRANGQVKVAFHGLVAERVAETHVGIGDEVILGLAGARLDENDAAAQTPGRYVAWDVHFDDRVQLEVLRDSSHFSTLKVDPPAKSVQEPTENAPTEVAHEPPVTPITPRTRPEGAETAPGLSSWASPAFLQRSRASFGTLVDSRIDPFAEEDGYIPGRGRKRPKFSMRSSEWRLIDEPATPDEKASPVDWTELDDEGVDGQGATEDVEMSQETPKIVGPLASEGEVSEEKTAENTAVGNVAVSSGQPIPEIMHDEQPAEPETTEATIKTPEMPDTANGLSVPIETPQLHPIPSPGLPVPSPLVTTSDSQQSYFASATTPRTQSTIVTQPHQTTEQVTAPIQLPEPLRLETNASHSLEGLDEDVSTTPTEPVPPQLLEAATTTSGEPTKTKDIQMEEHGDTTVPHDETAGLPGHDVANQTPRCIEIDEDEDHDVEDVPSDEVNEEDEDEYSEVWDEEDAENEPEEVPAEEKEEEEEDIEAEEDEEEEDDEEEEAEDQAVNIPNHPHGATGAADRKQESDESESAQSQEEEEGGYSIEDENVELEAEEIYDEEEVPERENKSEYDYEDAEDNFVDSGAESGEDEDEEENEQQAQIPPKNTQSEIIVLDSDDEDEPIPHSQAQPPSAPKEGQPGVPADQRETLEDPRAGEDEVPEGGVIEDEESEEFDEQSDDYSGDDYVPEEDDPEYEQELESGVSFEDNKQPEDEVTLVEMTKRAEDKQGEDESASESQEQRNGELEDSNMATPAEYNITPAEEAPIEPQGDRVEETSQVRIEGPSNAAELMQEDKELKDRETATKDLPHHSEQEVHDVSTEHVSPDTAVDPDLSQTEVGLEWVPEETQEIIETTSEARVERQSLEGDLEHEAEAGLFYDGSAPPNTTSATSEASQQDREETPDEFHDPSEGPLAHTEIQQIHGPYEDSEMDTDEAFVDAPEDGIVSTAENEFRSRSRSRSISITQEEIFEDHENAAHENLQHHLQAQAAADVEEVLDATAPTHDGPWFPQEPGRRSKSSFVPLANLPEHINTLTDTVSVVHDTTPITHLEFPSQSHYTLTLHLTDLSLAGTTVTAHLTHQNEEALPAPAEGDAILLRNFTVQSHNHTITLLPSSTSTWAVLSDSDGNPAEHEYEYNTEETNHAANLRTWYRSTGVGMVADTHLQASIEKDTSLTPSPQPSRNQSSSRDITPMSSSMGGMSDTDVYSFIDSMSASASASISGSGGGGGGGAGGRREFVRGLRGGRKGHRRITIHELRDGRRYAEVGSPNDQESIHELRDGTVYANL